MRALLSAVKATLDAPSFLYRGSDGPIQYQAPNRTRGLSTFGNSAIDIGRTTYQPLEIMGGVVTKWSRSTLTPLLDSFFGPTIVKFDLRMLHGVQDVHEHGGQYTVDEVVPAGEVSPGTAGQSLLMWSIKIHSGYVTSIRGSAYGLLHSYVLVRKFHLEPIAEKSLTLSEETFSRLRLRKRRQAMS